MTLFDNKKKIIQEVEMFAKNKMKAIHSSHGWDHVIRVTQLADKIALSEPKADKFILHIASILHDIEREEQDKQKGKICHAELGAKTAYGFLNTFSLDKKIIEHISQCILTHRYRNSHYPETIEAKILFDSDKLDSIGAIGIGRAFLFAGEVGAKLHDPNVDITTTHAYSEEDTAYREFLAKLQYIKDKMLTPEGKRLAENRHHFMKNYFERLTLEVHGEM